VTRPFIGHALVQLKSAALIKLSSATTAQDFNEKMVRFYATKDATEMMAFLVACHPEAITIQQNNT
jgi:hypothetical protein